MLLPHYDIMINSRGISQFESESNMMLNSTPEQTIITGMMRIQIHWMIRQVGISYSEKIEKI